jgi:hypothetical protein
MKKPPEILMVKGYKSKLDKIIIIYKDEIALLRVFDPWVSDPLSFIQPASPAN